MSSTLRARWCSRGFAIGLPRWSPNSVEDAQVGFHGHENLGLGVANSVEAVRAGAKQIDGSCRRFGAGAGNAPVEALIGVFDKIGVKTGIDFFDIADAAEEVRTVRNAHTCHAHRTQALVDLFFLFNVKMCRDLLITRMLGER